MKIQSPPRTGHRRTSEQRMLSPFRIVLLSLLITILLVLAFITQRLALGGGNLNFNLGGNNQPPAAVTKGLQHRLEQVQQQKHSLRLASGVVIELNAKLAEAESQLKVKDEVVVEFAADAASARRVVAELNAKIAEAESQLKVIHSYLKEYHRSSELATYLNSIASSVDVPKNLLPKERMRVKEKEKRTQEEESAVKHAADVDKAKQQDSSVAYYETNLGINEGGKTRNVSLLKPILQTKPDYFKTPKPEPSCPAHRKPSKRVAFIITNYNMPERTDQIVENIRKKVQWPVDIIVVDNGSDLQKQSKYTTIRLEKNVQTTNGWLVGLQYAKSLAAARKICYFAYWLWITSCLYDETQNDVLTPLAQFLIDHPKAAGIGPALTKDSTTHWDHLKKISGSNTPRKVHFIDELGVLWRASFFDSIGWFDPDELHGFGVDIETGYLARYSGRDIYLHDGVTVKKTSGVAYKMNRMNVRSRKRNKLAVAEMSMLLRRRYTDAIAETLWSRDSRISDEDQSLSEGTYTNRLGTWFDDYSIYPTYVSDGLPNIEIGDINMPVASITNNQKCKHLVKWKKNLHGWDVCRDVISDHCVVYAIGIGWFSQWDQMMSEPPYNCEVHSFDPTPTGKNHVKSLKNPGFTYHEMGVGITDGYQDVFVPTFGGQFTKTSSVPRNGDHPTTISIPVKTIRTIMKKLGHTTLDMLKIDIEGGEIEILQDLFSSPIDIKSVCAEFHSESPLPLKKIDQLMNNVGYIPYKTWHAYDYLGVYLGERCWFRPVKSKVSTAAVSKVDIPNQPVAALHLTQQIKSM